MYLIKFYIFRKEFCCIYVREEIIVSFVRHFCRYVVFTYYHKIDSDVLSINLLTQLEYLGQWRIFATCPKMLRVREEDPPHLLRHCYCFSQDCVKILNYQLLHMYLPSLMNSLLFRRKIKEQR